MNFLLPDLFGCMEDFDADEFLSGNVDGVNRLHLILQAFMLRRIKADVEASLLPKKEFKLYVQMTELQRDTYIKVLLKKVGTINAMGEASWKSIRMIMMELRINLATADTVIIYDSDWNPQADFQAIDRVHRIGQTKQVFVYRLISENIIDHRMVQRAEIKQRLDNMAIQNSWTTAKSQSRQANARAERQAAIDMIKSDAEKIQSMEGADDTFDLKKIMQESLDKAEAEKVKYDRMTLAEASNETVYKFESVDFRSRQA